MWWMTLVEKVIQIPKMNCYFLVFLWDGIGSFLFVSMSKSIVLDGWRLWILHWGNLRGNFVRKHLREHLTFDPLEQVVVRLPRTSRPSVQWGLTSSVVKHRSREEPHLCLSTCSGNFLQRISSNSCKRNGIYQLNKDALIHKIWHPFLPFEEWNCCEL